MPAKKIHFPNESSRYRAARDELLEAERKLRDATEDVAALRRALPPGGEVKEDYVFDRLDVAGRPERVRLSALFGAGQDTLFLYGYMFGPDAERPCPLCTSLLDGLDAQTPHLQQRIRVAAVARAPIERLAALGGERGWRRLPLLSSASNTYQSDYHAENEKGGQMPMANVFVKRDGAVRHFWGSELLYVPGPSGDSRHVDTLWPLWNVLDLCPDGRGETWYPALEYAEAMA